MNIQCQECSEAFPGSQTQCPHCGRPSLFPNVTAASQAAERMELDRRYGLACADTVARHCDPTRQQFEAAIRDRAKAVISTSFHELERLARSDSQVFSTYYKRVEAGLQIPTGGKWDVLRGVAEHALFPGYKDHIRFGALSLDGVGVKNYGDCSVVLKGRMVEHRTSLFEDNNVVFTVYDQKATMADAETLETGHRATWAERDKLCVAKLAPRLHSALIEADFPGLLLEQGATTREDRFVELHIWGSLTIRSVEYVQVHRKRHRPLKAAIRDVRRQLTQFAVPLDDVS